MTLRSPGSTFCLLKTSSRLEPRLAQASSRDGARHANRCQCVSTSALHEGHLVDLVGSTRFSFLFVGKRLCRHLIPKSLWLKGVCFWKAVKSFQSMDDGVTVSVYLWIRFKYF